VALSASLSYKASSNVFPVNARLLADWAEAHVRQLSPGAPPSPEAVAVMQRLEKAEPRNALALFYLGATFAAGDKLAAAQRWKTLLAFCPPTPSSARCCKRIKEVEER
jgi:cytochrome c-type biogenesis protein CcmH